MNKVLFAMLLLLLLQACASSVTVDPKGCEGQGVWHRFSGLEFEYDRYYDEFEINKLKDTFDFVIERSVKTPFGLLKDERIYLKSLLEKEGIRCYEVRSLTVSYHNTWKDVALSFVPLLGAKTLLVYGSFWEKRAVMEDEEPLPIKGE